MASPDKPAVQPLVAPHLVVDDAAAAIDFYVKAFGATEHGRVPHPGRPPRARRARRQRVHDHAQRRLPRVQRRQVDDAKGPRRHPGHHPPAGHRCRVAFQRALDAGATVIAPLEDQFWGDRYGVIRDPFGHHWSLGQPMREVSMEEIAEAMGKS